MLIGLVGIAMTTGSSSPTREQSSSDRGARYGLLSPANLVLTSQETFPWEAPLVLSSHIPCSDGQLDLESQSRPTGRLLTSDGAPHDVGQGQPQLLRAASRGPEQGHTWRIWAERLSRVHRRISGSSDAHVRSWSPSFLPGRSGVTVLPR